MGIIDIVFIVIFVIALLIGLRKGLAGIFFGFVGFLVLGIGLGFVLKFTVPLIVFSDVDNGVHSTIGETIYEPVYSAIPQEGAIGDLLFTPIIKNEGEVSFDTSIAIGEEIIDNPTLEQILAASFALPESITSIIADNASRFAQDGKTFATILANFVTTFAVSSVIWFVLMIILTITKNIIRRRVYKWLDRNGTASKVDRGLGVAVVALLIVCMVWGAGLFLTMQADEEVEWAVSANSYIEDNTMIIKELNKTNLFVMIAKSDSPNETAPTE